MRRTLFGTVLYSALYMTRKDKTLPRIQNNFPESKTIPRIRNTFQNPKTLQESKTIPRIQNTSQNPKTLVRFQKHVPDKNSTQPFRLSYYDSQIKMGVQLLIKAKRKLKVSLSVNMYLGIFPWRYDWFLQEHLKKPSHMIGSPKEICSERQIGFTQCWTNADGEVEYLNGAPRVSSGLSKYLYPTLSQAKETFKVFLATLSSLICFKEAKRPLLIPWPLCSFLKSEIPRKHSKQ